MVVNYARPIQHTWYSLVYVSGTVPNAVIAVWDLGVNPTCPIVHSPILPRQAIMSWPEVAGDIISELIPDHGFLKLGPT